MNNYRWLLMDADNTLFDFDSAEEFVLARTLVHFGYRLTPERKDCYRSINSALWKAYDRGEISQGTLSLERFERFFDAQDMDGDAEAWSQFFLNSLADCHVLVPGAEQVCRKLANRHVLVLTTNGIPYVQRRRLERSPLARFFGDRVFISGEMGCRKPDKRFFEKVLEALGARTQRERCLVIGDSLSSDIRGAFNARLDSVWVRPAGARAGGLKPTYEVDGLAGLTRLLEPDRLLPLSVEDMLK